MKPIKHYSDENDHMRIVKVMVMKSRINSCLRKPLSKDIKLQENPNSNPAPQPQNLINRSIHHNKSTRSEYRMLKIFLYETVFTTKPIKKNNHSSNQYIYKVISCSIQVLIFESITSSTRTLKDKCRPLGDLLKNKINRSTRRKEGYLRC